RLCVLERAALPRSPKVGGPSLSSAIKWIARANKFIARWLLTKNARRRRHGRLVGRSAATPHAPTLHSHLFLHRSPCAAPVRGDRGIVTRPRRLFIPGQGPIG